MPTDPRLNLKCGDCGLSFFAHLTEPQRLQAALNRPIDGPIGKASDPRCQGWRPFEPKAASLIPEATFIAPSPAAQAERTRVEAEINAAIDKIQGMLDDDEADGGSRWDFARGTLLSFLEQAQTKGRLSPKQLAAIDNIYEGGLRGRRNLDRWDRR